MTVSPNVTTEDEGAAAAGRKKESPPRLSEIGEVGEGPPPGARPPGMPDSPAARLIPLEAELPPPPLQAEEQQQSSMVFGSPGAFPESPNKPPPPSPESVGEMSGTF